MIFNSSVSNYKVSDPRVLYLELEPKHLVFNTNVM
jgi:hypothetical protein